MSKLNFTIYYFVIFTFLPYWLFNLVVNGHNCKYSSEENQKQAFVENLLLFSNFCQPYVLYLGIYSDNIRIEHIPDRLFANICVDGLFLNDNLLENLTILTFAGFEYLNQLYLYNNRIASITNLLRSIDVDTLTLLDLSQNRIRRLEDKFSLKFRNLQKLDLQFNYIEFISDFVFENLRYLNSLNLDSNKLKIISDSNFSGLFSLEKLILNRNLLEEIARTSFLNLSSLTRIELNSNNIQTVDFVFAKENNVLEELHLEANRINSIRLGDVKLSRLMFLYLSNNLFDMTSMSLGNFSSLKKLDLSNVDFEIIYASSFSRLARLKTLFINESNVLIIEANAFQDLVSLETLNLNSNRLSRLQTGIFRGLSNLTNLDLNSNIVSDLDGNIFDPLVSLTNLEFSKNLITNIPKGLFDGLKNIEEINLAYNRIKKLNTRVFCDLKLLKNLLLNGNLIETIEPDAFFNLNKLVTLELSQNKIRVIKSYSFRGLSSLLNLNLNENRINYIESGSFCEQKSLKTLDLSDNFIIKFESNAFRDIVCTTLKLTKTQLDVFTSDVFANSNIKSIQLDQNFFESLPFESFCYLGLTTQLRFSFNRLRNISNQLFCQNSKELVRLDELYLDHNQLSDLSFLASRQFKNLGLLDVSFNRIECLNSDYFGNLNQLEMLVASNNPIKHIDADFFDQLSSTLKTLTLVNIQTPLNLNKNLSAKQFISLDLSQNLIVNFDFLKEQFNLKQLYLSRVSLNCSQIDVSLLYFIKVIDFSFNLDDGNFKFPELASLETLILSNMKINSIARFEFSNFDNLAFLNLSHNEIDSVERKHLNCFWLVVLDLSHNRIEYIDPQTFNEMIFLKEIYFNHNKIKRLSVSFHTHIEILNVADNFFLNELFKPIGSIYFLEASSIDMSNNAISSLDFSLVTKIGCSLKTLVMRFNRLLDVNNKFLKNFQQLETINLESNFIESIERLSFRNNKQLIHINLANNSISSLDSSTFSDLVQLKYLSLSRNRLELIGEIIFSRLVNLEILDLSFNQLKLIENNAFFKLYFLKALFINENYELLLRENALVGLDSIVDIHVSFKFLSNSTNRQTLLKSLKAHKEEPINGVPYYRSINLLYQVDVEYPKVDCNMVLEFLKNNLQINLQTDFQLEIFFSVCQNTDIFINNDF